MPDTNLKQLAEWIAEQLGDWQPLDVESKYNHGLMHTENNIVMKLWVSLEGGRLKVSTDSMGLYNFTWMNERFPSITCSLTKTPPQIARDIERRVLPEYKTLLEKVIARKAISDERKRKQHQCCQELANILRAEMREGMERDNDPRVYCYGKGSSTIEFSVMSDTHVKIEIRSASFEAAKQIAHVTQECLRYGWNQDNEQAKIAQEEEEQSL
ncbi:MAG: hypothetical protein HZB51_11795 [Chloroflexi bacterium]|nr:hypothetical protein [Chloroflexota bacterium]